MRAVTINSQFSLPRLSITSVELKNIFVRAQNILDIDEVTLVQIFYI